MEEAEFSQKVNDFVLSTLERWYVPGASILILKDGKNLLCQGFGQRDIEQNLPMTSETLMPIASNTKAFTSMAVGLLVDEGKLEWDKPLRTWMPTFKMYDPVASEHMTPRDLLCHRSGLPRHDSLWYFSNYNRQEIFDRLRYLEPNSDFRSSYYYQNMMFMVAGLLVSAVTGQSWEAFVQERILDPLGMKRTNMSTVITQQDADHGTGYRYLKSKLGRIPYYEADGEKDALGPAGNICSCVSELSSWLKLHLNGGELDGKNFISAHNLEQMHTPHIFIDDPHIRIQLGMEFFSYGLGWFLRSFKGHKMIAHGGSMDGFISMTSFIPAQRLGIAVLTNGDGLYNESAKAITFTLYDWLLGLEETDWNGKLLAYADANTEAANRSQGQSSAARKPVPPSHPISDYTGQYKHAGYGVFSIRAEEAKLQLVINDKITMSLEPYHYDTFEACQESMDWHLKISFNIDTKGNIAGLYAQMEPEVKEIYFERLPDPAISDPALLAQLVGEYEVMDMPLVIRLVNGKLFASLPTQENELEPYMNNEFKLKGATGYSITFLADETGCFSRALLNQPGATFQAERKR